MMIEPHRSTSWNTSALDNAKTESASGPLAVAKRACARPSRTGVRVGVRVRVRVGVRVGARARVEG